MSPSTLMANVLLNALSDEQVLQANPLASVTRHCVVLREADGRSHAVLPVADIQQVQTLKTTFPGLLVIASALGLLAAAAQSSKDGHGAAIPLAVSALGFVGMYFNSRKASVLLRVNGERFETISGSLRDARKLFQAVSEVRSHTVSRAA